MSSREMVSRLGKEAFGSSGGGDVEVAGSTRVDAGGGFARGGAGGVDDAWRMAMKAVGSADTGVCIRGVCGDDRMPLRSAAGCIRLDAEESW